MTEASTRNVQGPDLRQWIKIVVYTLLIANWGYYFWDDWQIANHTLRNGGTFLDWTAAFAVSIDELAWFALLLLFELETYALSDEALTRSRTLLMHGARLLCYLFLAHTMYAYTVAAGDLHGVPPLPEGSHPCEMTEQEVSFGSNLAYTDLDAQNCHTVSTDTVFFLIEDGSIVTDTQGLITERRLVWVDLAEACVWLLILLAIEVQVRLQDRSIVKGPLVKTLGYGKLILYGSLWAAAAYWVYGGHYVYAWDEALWILGFTAIGMNMSDWKKEITEAEASASSSPAL